MQWWAGERGNSRNWVNFHAGPHLSRYLVSRYLVSRYLVSRYLASRYLVSRYLLTRYLASRYLVLSPISGRYLLPAPLSLSVIRQNTLAEPQVSSANHHAWDPGYLGSDLCLSTFLKVNSCQWRFWFSLDMHIFSFFAPFANIWVKSVASSTQTAYLENVPYLKKPP